MFIAANVRADSKDVTTFVIVVSKDSDPYRRCEQGVRDFLERRFDRPKRVVTIQISDKDLHQTRKLILQARPDMVVCIGTRAAFVLGGMRRGYRWVATFVIDKTIERLKKRGVVAVSMDVPIEMKMSVLCRITGRVRGAVLSTEVSSVRKIPADSGQCRDKDSYLSYFPFVSSIESALQNVLKEKVDAFFITADPAIFSSREVVAYTLLWGLRNKVAICGLSSGYVRNGALFALEADAVDLGRQAARLALDCLSGRKKAKVIVEHPDKYVLSINLRTASRLGMDVPASLLEEARVVIR